jgi:hypothetical protein
MTKEKILECSKDFNEFFNLLCKKAQDHLDEREIGISGSLPPKNKKLLVPGTLSIREGYVSFEYYCPTFREDKKWLMPLEELWSE